MRATVADRAIAGLEPEPVRPPGPLVRAWRDGTGLIGQTLRLAWRHWPVLLALALAGTIVRELVLTAAVKVTDFDALAAFLVFMLAPMALMIAMVLMLRSVRPSLPRIGQASAEPVLRHIGGVLVPFLVFYLYSGFLDYDYQRFVYAAAQQEMLDFFAQGSARDRIATAGVGVAIVAAVAFVLRWLLGRVDAVRRRPVLGVPAAYLEIMWLGSAFLIVNEFVEQFSGWWQDRVIWQAALDVWHGDFAYLGQFAAPLAAVRDVLSAMWTTASDVLVVPVAALLSGAVVLAVSTANLRSRRSGRLSRVARVGVYAARPSGTVTNLTMLVNTMRLVLKTGVPAMMLYCLLFAAITTIDEWLNLPERLLIGPRPVREIWEPLYFPLQWINQAVGLVLLMCLVAAAVERSPLGAVKRPPAGTASPDSGPASQSIPASQRSPASQNVPSSRQGEPDIPR